MVPKSAREDKQANKTKTKQIKPDVTSILYQKLDFAPSITRNLTLWKLILLI